jgi:antitoxin component HigA of HigAB toxin-antitoxin module
VEKAVIMSSRSVSRKTRRASRAHDSYLALIERFPLRPIRSERELDEGIKVIDEITDRRRRNQGEQDYLDVLARLVEDYETTQHPLPFVPDAEMLRHLIDAKAVTRAKVAAEPIRQPADSRAPRFVLSIDQFLIPAACWGGRGGGASRGCLTRLGTGCWEERGSGASRDCLTRWGTGCWDGRGGGTGWHCLTCCGTAGCRSCSRELGQEVDYGVRVVLRFVCIVQHQRIGDRDGALASGTPDV